jgi:hypothetical protein
MAKDDAPDDRPVPDPAELLRDLARREAEQRQTREEWRTIRRTLLGVGFGALLTAGTPPWLFVWLWTEVRPWLHTLTGP